MLRRKGLSGAQRGGFVSVRKVTDRPYVIERAGSLGDIYEIDSGGGRNRKLRFELGALSDKKTETTGASQEHSMGIGVGPATLPLAGDIFYVGHGASLGAERSIAQTGMGRGDRIHIHFYACSRNGGFNRMT